MEFIDTHVHWYVNNFKNDLPTAIKRAQAAGVGKFILPAIDSSVHPALMKTARTFVGVCFPCAGLHPTEVKEDWRKELNFVESQLSSPELFVAVGETGMDCYWSTEFITQQKTVFEHQLRLAARFNLPVIIHARDAFDVIFEVLDRVKTLPLRGVFHAYSGSAEQVERIRRYGDFKIGVGGVVTFKKASLAQVVAATDMQHIILETDAPWLAPVPYRGKRNESTYIPLIAARIAEIKKCSVEEVAATTTENAEALFRLNEFENKS